MRNRTLSLFLPSLLLSAPSWAGTLHFYRCGQDGQCRLQASVADARPVQAVRESSFLSFVWDPDTSDGSLRFLYRHNLPVPENAAETVEISKEDWVNYADVPFEIREIRTTQEKGWKAVNADASREPNAPLAFPFAVLDFGTPADIWVSLRISLETVPDMGADKPVVVAMTSLVKRVAYPRSLHCDSALELRRQFVRAHLDASMIAEGSPPTLAVFANHQLEFWNTGLPGRSAFPLLQSACDSSAQTNKPLPLQNQGTHAARKSDG
jgi:hypothetical protein